MHNYKTHIKKELLGTPCCVQLYCIFINCSAIYCKAHIKNLQFTLCRDPSGIPGPVKMMGILPRSHWIMYTMIIAYGLTILFY